MRLNQDSSQALFNIRAHGLGYVIVNDNHLTDSLVLTPERQLSQWPVTTIEDLDDSNLAWLLEDQPEVIIIGTGERQQFPSASVIGFFARRGFSVEFMDSGAACRTYAILASEGRRVALGLML